MGKACGASFSRRIKVYAILAFALVMIGAGVRLTGAAESLAYWPSREVFDTPARYEDVSITTEDGLTLHGWFMPAASESEEPKPAVLHLHGNAGNIYDHASFSDFLPSVGVSALIIDYRGYGRSDEAPLRRRGLLIDAHAALDYLLTRDDVDAGRIGVLGVSLGSAPAMALVAERDKVRAVATIGAFSSWQGVAHDAIPFVGPLLLSGGMDQVDAIERFGDRPYLIVHGEMDEVIDPRHAAILKARCDELGVRAELRLVPGADHNRILSTNPEIEGEIAAFFTQHLR